MTSQSPAATLAALRRLLLAVLSFGLVGTAIDLLLIGHDEDGFQMIPLAVVGLALVATAATAFTTQGSSAQTFVLRLFRTVMVWLMFSGALGAVLHFRANMEFKLEMDPSLGGLALFWSVVQAKAPPAMAPASLVLFGLLGLVAVYRRRDDPRPGVR
jgi:hypothetical protein